MQSTNVDKANFDQLWDYNRPGESEARFREYLATVDLHTPDYVELLTQIARAQGLQRNFAAAHQTLDEAQKLLNDQTLRAKIRYLLERGRVYNSAGQADQARPLFLQAWEQAVNAGEDFYAVDAAHMLGIIEPPEEQLRWNEKALTLAEQSDEPRAQQWLGSLYNNIGWTYHDLQQEERALALFQKALSWRLTQGKDREIRIATWSVARILRALNRVEEALTMQQALHAEWARNNEVDGYVEEEIGECLLCLPQPEQAQPYFAAAYRELATDPWLVEHEAARLERLRMLGKVEN